MTSRTLTAVLATSLLVLGGFACGSGAKDTCVQVGPPQGYPLRVADAFIATGHPHDTPDEITFLSFYGGQLADLAPSHGIPMKRR